MELAGRHAFSGTKLKQQVRALRKRFPRKQTRVLDWGYGVGIKELERHDWHVGRVAGHVAECPCSKIDPTPPVERVIDPLLVRPHGCGPYPGIPVQPFWNWVFAFGSTLPLGPDGTVRPDMNLCDISDCSTTDNLNCLTQAIFTCPLIAHLGHHAHLFSGLTHEPSFMNRPGQWLLAIDMLFHPHRLQCCHRMGMVRRADGDDVHLVSKSLKHLPKVCVLGSVRKLSCFLINSCLLDITEADNLHTLLGDMAAIAASLPANSNAGGGKPLKRRVFCP